MKYPSAKNMMLCWNINSDKVKLVPWPDNARLSDPYERTSMGCYSVTKKMTFEQLKTQCFIEAMHLIIRDGCDPHAVHRALLGCAEYRDGLAEDVLTN